MQAQLARSLARRVIRSEAASLGPMPFPVSTLPASTAELTIAPCFTASPKVIIHHREEARMYIARFSYDVLPINRQRAMDFMRKEVEAMGLNTL